MAEVLILDDDELFCQVLTEHIHRAGHGVSVSHTLAEGSKRASETSYDIVFLDVHLPDGSGLDILSELRNSFLPPEVIIVTGYGDMEGAELAIKHGAWDYLSKGASIRALELSFARALQHRESQRGAARRTLFHAPDMIGNSASFRAALSVAAQAADSDASVVVTGETGTGKELCAIAIHSNSRRAANPFVVVDCTALPETLVGSVLFGHARGAFTDAHDDHIGLIGQAHRGTLFLDEVGDMPMEVQKSFLRVLQERCYRPVGADETHTSDFRVIAATHRNLDDMVSQGTFRRDLLYRLRALTVSLPPLRERMDDLPSLITHFVMWQCKALDRDMMGINDGFLQTLMQYSWPGNVRELSQAIVSAVVNAGDEPTLFASHLPTHIRTSVIQAGIQGDGTPSRLSPENAAIFSWASELPPLREVRAQLDQTYLEEAIRRSGSDIEMLCQLSGLSRPHVYVLLKKHGLKLK
ncbi:MAG TPA: sigma-54 dependent transcriptional regulator [bacterium]|nr:sigma-54 dependent transcriptional regulator [bacterium]